MKTATGFDNGVTKTMFPVADLVFNNAIALDTSNSVFNAYTQTGNKGIECFFIVREFAVADIFSGCTMATLSSSKP